VILNSLRVLINLVFVQGLGFLASILAARMLGPTERGIVVVASLFATLIMGLSDLGLRPALLYNLSRADGVDQAIREGIAV